MIASFLHLSSLAAAATPALVSTPLGALGLLAPNGQPVSVMAASAADPAAEGRPTGEGLFEPSMRSLARMPDAPEIPNHPLLTDRFFFGLGAAVMTSNTEARLQSSAGLGTIVDFEDALGLESTSTVPQGLARWRFTDRWRVELEYFQLNRSSTRELNQEIVWGDQTFPVGTTIEAEFNVSVARLACGYSFFKTKDKELGVALGFHLTDIEAGVAGSGGSAEGSTLLAPLPVLSMYGQFALTDTWAVAGRLDGFKLAYDPFKGHIVSIGVDAICQPWRNLGFGLGWRTLAVSVSAESDDWRGDVQTNYSGPMAFITTSF